MELDLEIDNNQIFKRVEEKPLVVPIIRHSTLPFFKSFLQFVPNFQVAMDRELEKVIRTTDRLNERISKMPKDPALVKY